MTDMTGSRSLFSAKSLAAHLDVSERTVRQMLADGVIASFKVGGMRRVDPAVVDAYLAGQQEGDAAA